MTIKNMTPSLINGLRTRKIPDPNTPANPVPEPKAPTSLLGNPFKNPKIVDSPRAQVHPCIKAQNKANQKAASNVFIVIEAIKIYAQIIIHELIPSR